MEAYSSFAAVYDLFMDDVPYGDWCEYIVELLNDYEIEDGLILDLGCGTGSLTERLAQNGFDMIGVDNSPDMLEIARDKQEKAGTDILYLLQDMRSFELYGTVKAVISVCDSMNYIMSEEDLKQVFKLVNNYLDPHGIFVFDLNTVYKYQELMGDQTIAENREESSFIWENNYYEEEMVNEYDLTLFIKEEHQVYRKYVETHYQKAYELERVKELLEEAGMEFLEAYSAFTREAPKDESERIYVVARECGK